MKDSKLVILKSKKARKCNKKTSLSNIHQRWFLVVAHRFQNYLIESEHFLKNTATHKTLEKGFPSVFKVLFIFNVINELKTFVLLFLKSSKVLPNLNSLSYLCPKFSMHYQESYPKIRDLLVKILVYINCDTDKMCLANDRHTKFRQYNLLCK